MTPTLRIAWFSPFPPTRSGIASYSAAIVPALGDRLTIDGFSERNAHDFVWLNRRAPYDLTVFQLGNAPCHDYMWGYLVRYPGLVVLHDARLHHARARALLQQRRADDYRREFHYDHPTAPAGIAEYAVEGLRGSIHYFWSMLRVPVTTARMVAVHNPRVTAALQDEFPNAAIATIRMGLEPRGTLTPERIASDRARIRRALEIPDDAVVFAAFGKVTPEKRIGPMIAALSTLRRDGVNAWLMVVGECDEPSRVAAEAVRTTGYVADEEITAHLLAADVALCLRWPTALETSASWLMSLAAARPTVITDLAHHADVAPSVSAKIDLLNEEADLVRTMRRLASDAPLRADLGRAGQAYWAANHTLGAMTSDYRHVIATALAAPAPALTDLPAHFTEDYGRSARAIARDFDVEIDVLV